MGPLLFEGVLTRLCVVKLFLSEPLFFAPLPEYENHYPSRVR